MFFKSLCASLLFTAGAFAQSASIDIPYQQFVLDNGLTVIVHEDHKAPIVAVNTWYHVGSKNEKPGKTGFAHLFEHLMFGGSENFHGRYIDAMERVGATDLNGTTNNDRTNYFENVPTSALDYTLWLESDRMGHLLGSFDEKTLTLQRGVVQNEKRQRENINEVANSIETLVEYGLPDDYYEKYAERVRALQISDVEAMAKRVVRPDNLTWIVVGDRAKIEAGVRELNLGEVRFLDADGKPI